MRAAIPLSWEILPELTKAASWAQHMGPWAMSQVPWAQPHVSPLSVLANPYNSTQFVCSSLQNLPPFANNLLLFLTTGLFQRTSAPGGTPKYDISQAYMSGADFCFTCSLKPFWWP